MNGFCCFFAVISAVTVKIILFIYVYIANSLVFLIIKKYKKSLTLCGFCTILEAEACQLHKKA